MNTFKDNICGAAKYTGFNKGYAENYNTVRHNHYSVVWNVQQTQVSS